MFKNISCVYIMSYSELFILVGLGSLVTIEYIKCAVKIYKFFRNKYKYKRQLEFDEKINNATGIIQIPNEEQI